METLNYYNGSIENLLRILENNSGISRHTWRYHLQILRRLGLIAYNKLQGVHLTELGKFILSLLKKE